MQIGFYLRKPSGFFIDVRTGAGPYKTDDSVTFTIIAGTGSYTGAFSMVESGFYVRDADGVGPFVKQTDGTYKLVT